MRIQFDISGDDETRLEAQLQEHSVDANTFARAALVHLIHHPDGSMMQAIEQTAQKVASLGAPGVAEAQDAAKRTVVAEVLDNLGAIFRYMLPGALIVGAARVSHPSWFTGVEWTSWQHLAVLAVVAIAAGNAWFSVNRYVFHQLVDYVCYLAKSEGPSRGGDSWSYVDDLALWVEEALSLDVPLRARQHVSFRASSVLLIYTMAELMVLAAVWSEADTLTAEREILHWLGSAGLLAFGIWQNVITRRIDAAVLHRGRVGPAA